MSTATNEQDLKGTSPNDGKQKIEFSTEQQQKVQEFIDNSFGKGYNKAKTELANEFEQKIAELQRQLDETKKTTKKPTAGIDDNEELTKLRGELDEAKRVNGSRDAEHKQLLAAIEAERKRVQEAENRALNTSKSAEMMAAIGKIGFYNPAQIAKLTADQIQWNDEIGRFTVVTDKGAVEKNNSLEPITLDEFFENFATSNKHLVKSDAIFGAGSTASKGALSSDGMHRIEELFGPKATQAGFVYLNKIATTNPKEFERLKALAAERGLRK